MATTARLRRALPRTAAAGWVSLGALMAASVASLAATSGSAQMVAIDAAKAMVSAVAIAGAIVTCMRVTGMQRKVWFTIAVALVFNLAYVPWELINSIGGSHSSQPASLSGLVYLLTIPSAFFVTIALTPPASRLVSLRACLDAGIIAAALLFVGWGAVLGPLFWGGSADHLTRLAQVARPVSGICFIVVIYCFTVRAPRSERVALSLLNVAVVIATIRDFFTTYLTMHGISDSQPWVELASVLSVGIVYMASVHTVPAVDRTRSGPLMESPMYPLVPTACVVLALVAAGWMLIHGVGFDAVIGWDGIVALAMLILRQVVALYENTLLARSLAAQTATLIESEGRYRQLALHDSLTGLPNRFLLHDRIAHALARCDRTGERCALLFIDLNDFKPINDRHGHSVGDALLQAASSRITACLRGSDTAARIGGDEFAVLLEDVHSAEDGRQVANRIRASCADVITVGKLEVPLSASVGLAFGGSGVTVDELVTEADRAMYREKNAHRTAVPQAQAARESGDAAELQGIITRQ